MNAIVTAQDFEAIDADRYGSLPFDRGRHDRLAKVPSPLRGVRTGLPGAAECLALENQLAEAHATIAEQRERIAHLESLTMTDELTGLLNRRGFYSLFRREMSAARRHGGSGGGVLVLIDLDGFKRINDTHGHLAGDAYLRQVARLFAGAVRQEDAVARLGGDEFALLLTNTDANRGAARARDIADAAAGHCVRWNNADLPVRFSFGVQPYGSGDREEEVIRLADSRMYRDKANRRPQAANRRATA